MGHPAGGGKEASVTLTDNLDFSRTVPDSPIDYGVKFASGDAIGVWEGSGTWRKFMVSNLSNEDCTVKFTGTSKVACPYDILYPYSIGEPLYFADKNIGAENACDCCRGTAKPLQTSYTLSSDKKNFASTTGGTACPEPEKYPAWRNDVQGYSWWNTPYQTNNVNPHTIDEDVTVTFSKYTAADGKTVLESGDDAATAPNANWRTPTVEEYANMHHHTTYAWAENYKSTGVAGRLFTSKFKGFDDVKIFFPAAGFFSTLTIV